jgi:hypothetical protein
MADQVQCPHCNTFKVVSAEFRVNKDGQRIANPFSGCGAIAVLLGVPTGIAGVLMFGLVGLFEPRAFIFAAIYAGIFVVFWWIKKSYENNPAGYDHTCLNCGKKWTTEPRSNA